MITLTKPKRFFMGAFVGALFTKNTNKINNKQHVNRGYDSGSGTKFISTDLHGGPFFVSAPRQNQPFPEYCFNQILPTSTSLRGYR
ncbi:hypothetical protein FEM41_01235 [Jejubacter calystegiae]|uniref:Uncharacterized protein n=1 Tax=Jejubacter calystegiae TaxID=2579935 RepID=A0A4P8YD11_9ENTR|nr:hypothetical protein FEM41_01235 [Jejubacter calystegiae]